MKTQGTNLKNLSFGAVLATLVAAGCASDPELTRLPAAPSTTPSALGEFKYKTPVGVPVQASTDPKLIATLAARVQPVRSDPFALLPVELRFDQSQRGERLVGDMGYSTMFEPEVEIDESQTDLPEPQPYRRLAGVLVADTVSAIIIMEDGSAHLIKPGTRIPNSPWRVVSIDEEKAILRRAGNQKPTQIVIRLESPPAGAPTGGGAQPGGGFPGAPGGRGGVPGGNRGGARGGSGAPGDADR